MELKILTERTEIIQTGSVFVPYGEYVEFIIAGLTFRLSFEQDTEDNTSRVNYSVQEENGRQFMAIHAYNFEKALLSSVNESLKLGKIEGRQLSLQLAITSANRRELEENGARVTQCNMLVYYTWYLDRVLT